MWFWSSGRPLPEVVWLHNGQEVKESEDFHLLREEKRCTLLIQEVFPEDTGTYSCRAWNQHGADSTQCTLTVEGNVSAHHLQLRRAGPPFVTLVILWFCIRAPGRCPALVHHQTKTGKCHRGSACSPVLCHRRRPVPQVHLDQRRPEPTSDLWSRL